MRRTYTDDEIKAWAAEEALRRIGARRQSREVKITGAAFLLRAMSEPQLRAAMNLGAMTRFGTLLDKLRGLRRSKYVTYADRNRLLAAERDPQTKIVSFNKLSLPSSAIVLIYRIALAAGMRPAAVQSALVLYGLEYLAAELRANKTAPIPQVPTLGGSSSAGVPFHPTSPSFAPSPRVEAPTNPSSFPERN